jgi:outer membrane protein OmpA-like peptidoglycan-associated protein
MRTRFMVLCAISCGGHTRSAMVPVTQATATAVRASEQRADIEPPYSLTASDGSGLALVAVDAKAIVEGPLAFTELHLTFANDQGRVREGTFQITLPPRAAVSRFAMDNAGQWMEAEVVPKMVARRAYDDFLHRRQDPALLEKAAGNQFSAKVFPIPPNARKHLVISYSQELVAPYALPLVGLPRAERVDVEVKIDGAAQRLARTDWQPDRDFIASASTVAAVSAGNLVAARVEVPGKRTGDTPTGVTMLVDTSASRALGFAAYVASIEKLAGALGDIPLQVVAFDQDSELVFDGRAGDAKLGKLVERGAAGASDLGQALAFVAKRRAQPRVVVVTDGVITAGLEGQELAGAVTATRAARVDVVLAGGLRDDAAASRIARAGARPGAVLDLERDPVATALAQTVATDVAIDVAGASWVFPKKLASARAGTQVIVYARLAQPAATVDIAVAGVHGNERVATASAPLVERAIAGAELDELEAKLGTVKADEATAIRAAISAKSVASRVLSSETSMLVLESDGDYARYGIERKALADVLVVGAKGVEREHRKDAPAIPPRDKPATVIDVPDEPARPGEPPRPRVESPKARDVRMPTTDEPDMDHDGIPDAVDRCPTEPETYNGFQDEDGCPDRGRVIVTDTAITILDNIYFETNSATLRRVSLPIVDAVAATLAQNPSIVRIEVQGHTDDRGDDARNLDLSDRRANAVRDYLIGKGIAAGRLEAKGYGGTQPLDRAHNEAAWAKNRRVAFLILQRQADPNDPTPATPAAPHKAPPPPEPVTGELAEIQHAIAAHDLDGALGKARDWHAREPGNVLALVGLGEALEARHDAAAARIYGSIIDLYPRRADMRRFAGERLARLAAAQPLVIDTFRRAVADRPDHMTGYRLLAYAQVRAGKPADAFATILAGLDHKYRDDSYKGGMRVLADDAGMIGAVYAAAVPGKRAEIVAALAAHKLGLATKPSTRFILYWETDANDVDLHIEDARGDHAFYGKPKLASGGELYADITTGYGPECFAIPGTPGAGPYKLAVDYYSQGPMGYGMGLVEVQTFDPRRGFAFDDRPYVVMTNHAKLDVGTYR